MTTTAKTPTAVLLRLRTLLGTPDAVIGSDEGTNGKPHGFKIFEKLDGRRYAVRFAGPTRLSTYTVEQAEERTDGRIIYYRTAIEEVRGDRAEVARISREYPSAREELGL